jgi:phosphoribosylaminoimidazole-succinocarboxamide synthase
MLQGTESPRHDAGRPPTLNALLETDYRDLKLIARGKVRDIYDLGDHLLLVATDRISAFDHVLATGIPGKGKILTQLSLFWFDLLADATPNHLETASVAQYPEELWPYREELKGRSMVVRRAAMYPVECVARGYLAGSGWKEYKETGKICGIPIQRGLWESDRLKEPIFTPATKNERGTHDENISFDRMAEMVGGEVAERLRELTMDLYRRAAAHAEWSGLLLADTKFEFGAVGNEIVLADEVLTPDSSRFWEREHYRPGKAQASLDKQYVRDYLESIHWNKQAPAPSLPEPVVKRTQEKYLEAFRLLTGSSLAL